MFVLFFTITQYSAYSEADKRCENLNHLHFLGVPEIASVSKTNAPFTR